MNLFDQLVLQAMKNKAELAPLRVVVEKELLHHDIIREMSAAGLLDSLTFIGGTCLRAENSQDKYLILAECESIEYFKCYENCNRNNYPARAY